VIILFLTILGVRPALSCRSHDRDRECRRHLGFLGITCRVYAEKFGEYPPSLRDLFESGFLGDQGEMLVCPMSGNRRRIPPKPTWEQLRQWVSYEYRPPPASTQGPVNPEFVILWEGLPHDDGTRSVVGIASGAKRLSEDEFREALEAGP
jgi:hypothetical protein